MREANDLPERLLFVDVETTEDVFGGIGAAALSATKRDHGI